MMPDDDEGMNGVEIGLPTAGNPAPRTDGFVGRLRRNLERLEVGMTLDLLNCSLKQERYIRARIPQVAVGMGCKFRVYVLDNRRNRTVKRTLRIWRLE